MTAGRNRENTPVPSARGPHDDDSEKWATAVCMADVFLHGYHQPHAIDDVSLSVQQLTKNVILCGGPIESFSQKMPAYVPLNSDEEKYRPIDVLYGCYNPKLRSIEIYVKRIEQDASMFRCKPSELIRIVRIHEYVHAVVHLGVVARDIEDRLSEYGSEDTTDWDSFISTRLSAFSAIDTNSHEFLAQAITLACLTRECNHPGSERLMEVFKTLEEKQPPRYGLSPSVKERVPLADWALVLEAARGKIDCYRGESFSMPEGLAALVKQTAEQSAAAEADPRP